MRVVEASGCPSDLAGFFTPGFINETKAPTVARASSHHLLVGFKGILTRLEERQSALDLDSFGTKMQIRYYDVRPTRTAIVASAMAPI